MSKILKNNTVSPVAVSDTGITISASSQYTIPATDYLIWAASDDVITYIGNSTLTVNDGSSDLSISDGTKLIQGIFPTTVSIETTGDNPLDMKFSDTLNFDSFHSLRISGKNPIIEVISNRGRWDMFTIKELGSGTYDHNVTRKFHELDVTTASGDAVILQTRKHGFYSAGQSSLFYQTAWVPAAVENQDILMGWFETKDTSTYDDYEGVYWHRIGTEWHVCVTSWDPSFSDVCVPRSNWLDPLDGTGPSGVNISMEEMGLILCADLQYLGIGRINFFIEVRFLDGTYGPVKVHEVNFNNSTTYDSPYLTSPAKPLRWEIRNTGVATSSSQLRAICGAYFVEGGDKPANRRRSMPQAIYDSDVDTTWKSIAAGRVQAYYHPGTFLLKKIIAMVTTSTDFAEYRLVVVRSEDFTLAEGGTWTSLPHSIIEYTQEVGSIADYKVIEAGMSATSAISDLRVGNLSEQPGWDLDGNPDIFVIQARGFQDNTDMYFQMAWEELF